MRLVLRSTLVPYTTLFRSGLAQRGGPVAPFAQLRSDPDADVDRAAGELAEHHPDLLGALDRDEPGDLLVALAGPRRADLVIAAVRGGPRDVARGAGVGVAPGDQVQAGV